MNGLIIKWWAIIFSHLREMVANTPNIKTENLCPKDCPFCHLDDEQILFQDELVIRFGDSYPISPGHTLIIPKRHIPSLFDATDNEQQALLQALRSARHELTQQYAPDGYNIGINDGLAAGQTVMHLHIHLIPRYSDDCNDPRGGVRWIFPEKAAYFKKE